MLSSLGGVLLLVGTAQYLFFPNIYKDFDPDIFIFIYGAFGGITWFLFKVKKAQSMNQVLKLFFVSRLTILILQMFCYSIWGYYNWYYGTEVGYYGQLADALLNPVPYPPWGTIKFGIPPGFQFWLLIYDVLIFNLPIAFYREIAFGVFNMAFELGTIFVIVKMHESKSYRAFTRLPERDDKDMFSFGILFYAVSIFNLYYSNVRNFMDAIPIFLGILGLFFFIQKRYAISSFLLSLSTLMKFVPLFWILLIVLKFIKTRDFKAALLFTLVAATTATIAFVSSALYFKQEPISYFFNFFELFQKWSTKAGSNLQLNQAFWFPIYNGAFFAAGLLGMAVTCLFFV
ncbi:MAG: hypothetical protein Q6373_001070, partial [Candidatus Sigynarchaeota archaeon]